MYILNHNSRAYSLLRSIPSDTLYRVCILALPTILLLTWPLRNLTTSYYPLFQHLLSNNIRPITGMSPYSPRDPAPFLYHIPNTLMLINHWDLFQPPLWQQSNGFGTPFLEAFETNAYSPFRLLDFILVLLNRNPIHLRFLFELQLAVLVSYALARLLSFSQHISLLFAYSYCLSGPILALANYPESSSYLLLPFCIWSAEMARTANLKGFLTLTSAISTTILTGHPEASLAVITATYLYVTSTFFFSRPASEGAHAKYLALTIGAGLFASLITSFQTVSFLTHIPQSVGHIHEPNNSRSSHDALIVMRTMLFTLFDPGLLPQESEIGSQTFYSSQFTGYLLFPALLLVPFSCRTRILYFFLTILLGNIALIFLVRPWGIIANPPYYMSYYAFPTITFAMCLYMSEALSSLHSKSTKETKQQKTSPSPYLLWNVTRLCIQALPLFALVLLNSSLQMLVQPTEISTTVTKIPPAVQPEHTIYTFIWIPTTLSLLFYIKYPHIPSFRVPPLNATYYFLITLNAYVQLHRFLPANPIEQLSTYIPLPYSTNSLPPNSIGTSTNSTIFQGNSAGASNLQDARLTTVFHNCRYVTLVYYINTQRATDCAEAQALFPQNNQAITRYEPTLFSRLGINILYTSELSHPNIANLPEPLRTTTMQTYGHILGSSKPIVDFSTTWVNCGDSSRESLQLLKTEHRLIIDTETIGQKASQNNTCSPNSLLNSPANQQLNLSKAEPGYFNGTFTTNQDAILYLRQTWSPNWRLEINQTIVPTTHADYLFIGTPPLSPGSYIFTFFYMPAYWYVTYLTSVICSSILLGFILWYLITTKTSPRDPVISLALISSGSLLSLLLMRGV